MKHSVTMRSVAEKAGVHVSTVSLCLRDHPSIPASTRQRIQGLAQKMGYRPNAMVSTLMASLHTRRTSSESPILSLILEEGQSNLYVNVPFYRNLLDGARKRAAQLGYLLEDTPLKMEEKAAAALHRRLHNRNVRGVIVAPLFSPGGECPLPFEGFASCALGHSLHKPDLHRVVSNYAQAMRMAWDKFLEKGYRRPGFIHPLRTMERLRYDMLGTFLARQIFHPECAAIPPLLFQTETEQHSEERARGLSQWFKLHRPDVLVSAPHVLLPLLKILGGQIRVPEDAGVILINGEPGWARVQDGAELIGSGAVDLVVAQIHRNETGIPPFPKTVSINASWGEGTTLPDRR